MHESDQKILTLYKQGKEHDALKSLMNLYQKRLYIYIRNMVADHDDADDVLQNTFIKSWKGLANFKGESGIYTWLYRIATNEAITFINKKKKQQFQSIDDVANELNHSFDAQHYSGNDIKKKLDMAVQMLPNKQKAVFIMKYYQEKKYTEMSEIFQTSVGALKASYHIAVGKIEEILKND